MKTRVLKGLDDDVAAELKAQFVHSARWRKRMVEVLNEDIDALHASMRKEENFDSPNWSLIQADRVAQVKALKKFISLLEN